MHLYLLRHGEALPENLDPRRPLSERGKEQIKAAGNFLKRSGAEIDAFYHSGKNRAQQSAEIVRQIVNPQAPLVRKEHLEPEDHVEEMMEVLKVCQENILIAGHLPYLAVLMAALLKGPQISHTAYPTGTVAVLEKDASGGWNLSTLWSPSV